MKLSAKDIKAIERLLNYRERGKSLNQIADAIGATSHSEVSHAYRILKLVGVSIPEGQNIGGRKTKPTAPRLSQGRVLTASEWEVRLASAGF